MSFALLRKAFGIGKAIDEKEFDDFFKVFDGSDALNVGHLSKLLKKKAVRLLVLKNEDSGVIFDSSAQKESVKSVPILNVGRQQCDLRDMAFGSYSLNSRKPLLFSTKVHDMSSSGQLLFTRVISDIDEWRKLYLSSGQNPWVKRGIFTLGNVELKHETSSNRSLAVCLLINLEWCSSTNGLYASKTLVAQKSHSRRNFHLFNSDVSNQAAMQPSVDNCFKNSPFSPRRFYRMLFEHWTQLSLLVETLTNECAVAVCNGTRSCWGTHNFVPEPHCTDVITKAFNNFLDYFRDLCLPKLSFPVWSTLNVTLSIGSDSLPSYFEPSRTDCVAYWLNMDPSYCQSLSADCSQASKDNLADIFVKSCLVPLIIKGNNRDHRNFLSRLLTGVLMFHTGWLDGVSSKGSRSNLGNTNENSSSSSQNVRSSLLNQLLTQTSFIPIGTDAVCGSIFNCTVISGQSRAYMMALLYFVTYFLRFLCLTHAQECVPELGQADLFELEQQKRRTRLGGKSRRKSGSATSSSSTNCGGGGGDAHDSGISSQEDLTSMVYSASTGSSPTHVSGMALCMTRRLTRDQCRMAEAAAQLMVTREAAAAAAAAAAATNMFQQNVTTGPPANSLISVGETRSPHSTEISVLSDGSIGGSCLSNSPRSYRQRYTEVPLLIEKYFDGDEELCSCLPTEIIPGYNMNPPPPTTTTSNRYSTSLTTAAATTTSPGGGRSNSSSTTYTTNTTMHVSEHHYHHPHPHQYNVKTSSSSASACSSASSSLSSSYLRISSQSVDRSSKQMFYASQTRGGGGVGNQEMVPSTSKSIDGCNLSSLIDNHNNTNMPSSSSSLSGIYADTDRHHQQLQQQHNLDSLHHRSAYQTFVNHSLISATVSDIYHTGHVLQATTESPDSFKSRLEENLIQWLTYGPLVVSDFNSLSLMNNNNNNNNTSNSNVKIVPDVYSGQPSTSSSSFKLNHSHQRLSSRQFKHPKWSATALVINCDTKSVEALTLVQPNLANLVLTKEPEVVNSNNYGHSASTSTAIIGNPSSVSTPSSSTTTVQHIGGRDRVKIMLDQSSLSSTSDSLIDQPILITPIRALSASVSRRNLHIKPAPLISRLIEQIHLVLDTTNCSLMTLKHLECNLQLLYRKSMILTNLLIKEGAPLLQRIDRMTTTVGCLPDDLPLLLSIASSCSIQAANILHTSHFDWLNL
uniref:Folliculin-interacting protein middle domain-containing protein n=1 Tax=Trichobilharzia regenti TaxID=157069 RepID=A0AA85KDL1_TRIRE|nr:unnamed protein product [Trichobilharzia regenti]